MIAALGLAVNMLAEELTALTGGLEAAVADRTRELESAQRRLAYQAGHDHLTGLANRRLLHQQLEHLLVRRSGGEAALLLLDLDGFKHINDALGHGVGDAVLVEVARRLQQRLRPGDLVARLGGDEFAVLLGDPAGAGGLDAVGRRLLAAFTRPISVEGRLIRVRASIGIAPLAGAPSAQELLRLADVAMYQAKADGKDRVRHVTADLGDRHRRRGRIEQVLRDALADGGLPVVYQPLLAARTQELVGAEALVRWPHVSGPVHLPEEFIPIAEDAGLIDELGSFVLRQACQDAVRWSEKTARPLRVHVNVSGRQLVEPGFADMVLETLAETGATPRMLGVEVTESVLMAYEPGSDELRKLRCAGVLISVDDFGTGYSSLAALRRLPADVLKIDRSFVAGLGVDDDDGTVVRAVLGLAAGLRLSVVAEGVETRRQHAELARLGCQVVQGYLYARPMPFGELLRWSSPPLDDLEGS